MRYLSITSPDINNGLGCRVTLWISGCNHNCPGCHNQFSHDYFAGKEFTEDTLKELVNILNKSYIKGLTLSGGDPLAQSNEVLKELVNLLTYIKDKFPNKDIWCYTGYYIEDLNENQKKVVDLCDILVDGPYKQELRDTSLAFRGSANQRIINIHNK